MTRIVFLDTEAVSLDDRRGHMWEIGLIERTPSGDVEWLWQVTPEDMLDADPNSLRIGGFYERFDPRARKQGALIFSAPGKESSQPEETDLADVAAALAGILSGAHVVGAVPDFDFRMLRTFLWENGHVWSAHYHLIDIEALAVGFLHGVVRHAADQLALQGKPHSALAQVPGVVAELPWKSTRLYRAVGVDPDQFAAHTALGDARLARAVFDAITGGAR